MPDIFLQGHFIAMTHNLMLLLEEELRSEEGIYNEPELNRRPLRREAENEKGNRQWHQWRPVMWLLRSTQRGVKFIRWLRAQLAHRPSWRQSCEALTLLYARL